MSTSYTTNAGLALPAVSDRGWGPILNSNTSLLDVSTLGGLATRSNEIPSTTLIVAVAPGSYQQQSGAYASYAGGTITLSASTTRHLWLGDLTGTLTQGAAWPATAHVRLATVVAGATTITSVTDARVIAGSAGFPGLQVSEAGGAARMGLATLVAGTVTVATTAVTASTRVFLSRQTNGGTVGTLAVTARSAGASFTVTSSSGSDTSSVAWLLVEPA